MKSAGELIEDAKRAREDSRLDDALRYVSRAIELCRNSNDQMGLIASIKALGHLEADRKDYRASAAAYREALELARRNPDPLVIAHTVRHLGDVLTRLGEASYAEVAYAEAVALYQAHVGESVLDHANALRAFARLMDATNRPDEALALWARARDLYASAGVQDGVIEASARLGT